MSVMRSMPIYLKRGERGNRPWEPLWKQIVSMSCYEIEIEMIIFSAVCLFESET